ncbi:pyruvate dehydrogenase E1 [Binucleata daphniae]
MTKVRDAICKALEIEMENNKKIFIIGEEVGKSDGTYKATKGLLKKFGKDRVVDTPISEIGFTGLAVGASYVGLVPVCEFMTWNFALQAIDHIVNSSAKMRYMSGGLVPSSIVFRGPNGFSPGVAAQHTQDFCSWYGSVPGLKVVAPYSAKDHFGITRKALKDGNPVVILENEELYNKDFDEIDIIHEQDFECVIEKEGEDVTVIGISLNVEKCLLAAESFDANTVEVINLLSIRPLDLKTIFKSVTKTKRLLIVDNAWPNFSVASEISASVHENLSINLIKPVKRLNGKDCPTAYAINLETMSFPTVEDIIAEIKALIK